MARPHTVFRDVPPGLESINPPSTPSGAVSTHEILEQLDRAIADHMLWLKAWHRSLLCAEAPFPEDLAYDPQDLGRFGTWYVKNQHRGLVDQPAVRNLAGLYRELHDQARGLARDARAGLPLPREAYDAFMDTSAAFVAQARRLERAFATASSDLDPLTGVHNRQAMERDLERERTRAVRSGRPCCFALADLDHFKAINDAHGHGAGDRVLVAAAERFLATLRPYDSIYRYGGEEFLFCLPDTSEAVALKASSSASAARWRTVPCPPIAATPSPSPPRSGSPRWMRTAPWTARSSGRTGPSTGPRRLAATACAVGCPTPIPPPVPSASSVNNP